MSGHKMLVPLCLGLLIAPGCSTTPEARPTKVVFTNSTAAPIFVSCDESSFDVDDGWVTWRSSAGWNNALCEDCHSMCNSEYFADPGICFLEIPPQGRYAVDWDGRLYDYRPAGCSCSGCYQPVHLSDGEYSFVLRFERQLPSGGSSTALPDGTIRHFGGLGVANPSQRKRFTQSFSGQPQLDFLFVD
jgi:hypothetical protein